MGDGPHGRQDPGRAWVPAVVIVALTAVMTAACGGPRYSYVRNASYHTFLKVPKGWKTYDQDTILRADSLTEQQVAAARSKAWTVGFDSAPHPSVNHVASPAGADHPVGVVRARTLSAQERDGFSLASLRTEVLQNDPLATDDPSVMVVKAANVDRPGGLHGSDIIVRLTLPDGGDSMMRQVAFIDAQTHRVHILAVFCSASCFSANEKVISRVIDSWTVKEH